MKNGPQTGAPIVDVVVTLIGGHAHATDSNDLAFRTAASMAFKEAFARSTPLVLEPVMLVQIETIQEHGSAAIREILRRGGSILSFTENTDSVCLEAELRLSNAFHLSGELKSVTRGMASCSMEFIRYDSIGGGSYAATL